MLRVVRQFWLVAIPGGDLREASTPVRLGPLANPLGRAVLRSRQRGATRPPVTHSGDRAHFVPPVGRG